MGQPILNVGVHCPGRRMASEYTPDRMWTASSRPLAQVLMPLAPAAAR